MSEALTVGISQVFSYFSNPANHLDQDTQHVSKEEFDKARGKISFEADSVLEAIVYDDNKGYKLVRSLQTEGWLFSDRQISLRDLRFLQLGRGVGGRVLSNAHGNFLGLVASAQARKLQEKQTLEMFLVGFSEIVDYFANSYNHLDDDTLHVSGEEFETARRKVSSLAEIVLNALVREDLADNNGYTLLRNLQKEGRLNHQEVSLRDLYALRRGKGYDKEALGEDYSNFLAAVKAAYERKKALYNEAEQICKIAKGLPTVTEHFFAIERSESGYKFDLLSGELKHKTWTISKTVMVEKLIYYGLKIEDNYMHNGKEWEIDAKSTKDRYYYLSDKGTQTEIDFEMRWLVLGKCAAKLNLAEINYYNLPPYMQKVASWFSRYVTFFTLEKHLSQAIKNYLK